jgi:peptidyl-prolyl cis-trans isomerase D
LAPSKEDSAATLSQMNTLLAELRETSSDSAFVVRNSEAENPFRTIFPGDPLPVTLTNNVESPEQGEFMGLF